MNGDDNKTISFKKDEGGVPYGDESIENGSPQETAVFHIDGKTGAQTQTKLRLTGKIDPPDISEESIRLGGKQESIFTPRVRNRSMVLSIFFVTLFMMLVLVAMIGMAGLGALVGVAQAYVETTPVLDVGLIENQAQTSIIYDANGNAITTFTGIENRDWAKIDDIPDMLQNAFIAVEDVRFYKHSGIDFKRLFSAVINTLRNQDAHGGSTITQQLIKNRVLSSEVSYKRKIQEAYLAAELEQEYTKKEILEAYLNAIHLGESNYGVKAAAEDYFAKELKDLTIRECAMIAGLTQNPYSYNPRRNMYTRKDFSPTDKRTDIVLGQMYQAGYITLDQYNNALVEKVSIVEVSKQKQLYDMPYFVEYAVYDVITHMLAQQNLQDNKQNRAELENKIRTGGYKIYTTVDATIQNTVQQTLSDWDNYPKLRDPAFNVKIDKNPDGTIVETPQPQAAAVVIDYRTGQIKAMAGGRYPPQIRKGLNRAWQGKTQVGSSIKPIAVYGPALDAGASPGTIMLNYPIEINGYGGRGYPNNFEKDKNYGPITVRQAVRSSINIVAARTLFEWVSPVVSKDYLVRMGVDPSRINVDGPGLALGTSAITPLEMSAAFGTIANGGLYLEPLSFTKVVDAKGAVVLDADQIRIKRQVYKPGTSWMLTSMLEEAVKSGTGTRAKIADINVAGKTGTNDDFRSVYFAGYTPYYVSAVWIGHDSFKPQLRISSTGGTYAAPLWQAYMKKIHEGLGNKPIISDDPSSLGLIQCKVCTISGKLATSSCDSDNTGHKPVTDWFAAGSAPTEMCNYHIQRSVCLVSGKLANEYCPAEQVSGSSVLVIPPDSPLRAVPEEMLIKSLPSALLEGVLPEQIEFGTPEYDQYYCSAHGPYVPSEPQGTRAQILLENVRILLENPIAIIGDSDRAMMQNLSAEIITNMQNGMPEVHYYNMVDSLESVYLRVMSENGF